MNKEANNSFIDIKEEIEIMDEEYAKELFKKMLSEHGPKKIMG